MVEGGGTPPGNPDAVFLLTRYSEIAMVMAQKGWDGGTNPWFIMCWTSLTKLVILIALLAISGSASFTASSTERWLARDKSFASCVGTSQHGQRTGRIPTGRERTVSYVQAD